MMFYYVDESGMFLGGWDTPQDIEGATLVDNAPLDARQSWNGLDYDAAPKNNYESADKLEIINVLVADKLWESTFRPYIYSNQLRQDQWLAVTKIRLDHPLITEAIEDEDFELTIEIAQNIINRANELIN